MFNNKDENKSLNKDATGFGFSANATSSNNIFNNSISSQSDIHTYKHKNNNININSSKNKIKSDPMVAMMMSMAKKMFYAFLPYIIGFIVMTIFINFFITIAALSIALMFLYKKKLA